MPCYRLLTYGFRMAGIIYAPTEDAQWTTENEFQRIARTAREMLQPASLNPRALRSRRLQGNNRPA
jgi:hypothetical protein